MVDKYSYYILLTNLIINIAYFQKKSLPHFDANFHPTWAFCFECKQLHSFLRRWDQS